MFLILHHVVIFGVAVGMASAAALGKKPAPQIGQLEHQSASAPAGRIAAVEAEAETQPTTRPSVDAEADRLLDLMEQAGEVHQTLTADLRYDLVEVAFADTETREGKVYYQRAREEQPARFRIQFETVRAGGTTTRDETDYVFTGTWFITRKPRIKQQVEYQVARPGETVDALKLGQGPFPVPFGQSKQDVLEVYHASATPSRPGPPGTSYLLLTPREDVVENKANRLELWVQVEGPLAGLPMRIISHDEQAMQVTTVTFRNVRSNMDLPRNTFELPRPPRDWEFRREPLRAGQDVR